jgi:hypothetical protein
MEWVMTETRSHKVLADGGPGAAAPETGEPSAAATSRSDRLLSRVDDALAGLSSASERRRFIQLLTEFWERRYHAWVHTGGLSEWVAPGADPIHANDFLLVLTGLQARLKEVTDA